MIYPPSHLTPVKTVRSFWLYLIAAVILGLADGQSVSGAISLCETLTPSALHDLRRGAVVIRGSIDGGTGPVLIRVTDSKGDSIRRNLMAAGGKFACRYPDDFPGAPALYPGMLFVDATESADFDAGKPGHFQAEAAVIVHGGGKQLPDFPDVLTTDLLDRKGGSDEQCANWPSVRKLTNLYMQSRGARISGLENCGFDLARPADFAWFKNHLALYDFSQRDRDWVTPLGARVARTFWYAASGNWFNASNDNPLDDNPRNKARSNYSPYGFSNDFADWLVLYWMRTRAAVPFGDNLLATSRDATRNLLALQHRAPDNFALPDGQGQQEHYSAGAFRYGMFCTGEFMTEGTGWFYKPEFKDYIKGGVFNGRCLWGLGEALRHDPVGPLAAQIKEAIQLGLKFCLHDGVGGGYTKKSPRGNLYWIRPGEHSYLVLGMLAAYEGDPGMEVSFSTQSPPAKLKEICIWALNALVDLKKPGELWSPYPNEDAMALLALAQGALLLKDSPDAGRWREAATRVADAWLAAKVDPKERNVPCVHFGFRRTPETMTYNWMGMGKVQFFYYITGHWIHALADLYSLTGDPRYRERAEAMISYLCGSNPFKVRLFTETGGIYNWSNDNDGDGIEDKIKQDMYPESSAFTQIGILRLIGSLP